MTRVIEAGCMADCPECLARVKFRSRHRDEQVICNIYDNGVWQRVEHYHAECYVTAGMPYGEPTRPSSSRSAVAATQSKPT